MTRPTRAVALAELPAIGPAVVTMGVFDGLHSGHRAVLQATTAAAAERGISSVALVFDPPPGELLRPGSAVPRLAPLAVNLAGIEAAGIDRAVPIRFDEELRKLSAEEFLEGMTPAIELRGLAMSRHSSFGRDRAGTVERMQQLGAQQGFSVVVVEPVEVDGVPVSSTRIRAAIGAGDLPAAQRLGVTPYLEGTVVVGDRRGRELGFPTANLRFDYLPAMPPLGIYAGRTTFAGRPITPGQPSLISIGTRPTFHPGGDLLAEVHLLDVDEDLYGMRLGVDVVARLRDELRFDGAAALVEQMHRDAEMGRSVLESS
ncbi:MAG: riboflavin biosynthesis protein RibF [Chloroflexota bacterium]